MSDEINKQIHELLGKCWHEWPTDDADMPTLPCSRCGSRPDTWPSANPDYSHDLNAVAEAEKLLVAKGRGAAYFMQLAEITEGMPFTEIATGDGYNTIALITATAEQRCKAILKASA